MLDQPPVLVLREAAEVLRAGAPLIDLRAPAEFARGSLPGAINLPILDDDQRARVGKCFKQHGQAKAVALGHRLVCGDLRAERTAAWAQIVRRRPDTLLFCWRGGLRSSLAQQWLQESEALEVARVEGGYKALRRAALTAIEGASERPMVVVSGRTGVGKTEVMLGLPGAIDLEALAHHRGSAFGRHDGAQPTPISFENQLARAALLGADHGRIILEDEGRTIGRLAVPLVLHQAMQRAPLVIVEAPLAERVAHIRSEYVDQPLVAGTAVDQLHQRYASALARIRDRLGGAAETELRALLDGAFEAERRGGSGDHHHPWIAGLLRRYYDRMYDHQLARKQDRVCFSGQRSEVRRYLSGG